MRPSSVPAPRSNWPLGIALGFGVVFVANAIMVSQALDHPSVPAATDRDLESERYEQVLQERRAAAALGWTVTIEACPRGLARGACRTTATVEDADGRAVTGLRGTLSATRGDTTEFDRTATFESMPNGHYAVDLPLGAGGLYRFDLRFEGGAAPWVGRREVWVERSEEVG